MFSKIKEDIYAVLAGNAYKALNLKTFPDDYTGDKGEPTYLIMQILTPGASNNGYALGKQISGLLIFSIYVRAGNGDKEFASISDKLDGLFQGKTLTNGTQFGVSFIKRIGQHPDNPAIYRSDYAITFMKYGE